MNREGTGNYKIRAAKPFYNARKPNMSIRRVLRAVCLSLSCSILLVTSLSASTWTEAARELSGKIAAATGPGAVALEIENRSSLNKNDVAAITAELRSLLEGAGLRLVETEQAVASVQVTLSENVQSYLWVVRVQQGENPPAVLMVTATRAGPAVAARDAGPAVAIAKIQLWSQANRMLDVGVIDSPPRLIILEPERIVLYSRVNTNQWQLEQEFPVSHVRPWPRDLRARIVLRKDRLFDAYFPGVLCSATTGGTLHVRCSESDDAWPLAGETPALKGFFSPTRNFFTGVLVPGLGKQAAVSAFYSAAPVPRENYVLWLFAAVDGQIHAVDGMSDLAVSSSGWGSDMAGVKSTCGTGWQVLAASSSDGSRPDAVRAFQFPDRDPVAVSDPVDMGGTVVALWTEQPGSSAVAISRNLRTGQYDAFRLAISCAQ